MSKELQAFKELLKQLFPNYDVAVSFDDICDLNGNLSIIRNALKKYDYIDENKVYLVEKEKYIQDQKKLAILDRLQMILGAETVDDLPDLALKIDNEFYSACYELKQAKLKLKALEIIKSKEMLSVLKDTINDKCFIVFNTTAIEIPQEEYDLLKEVLL